MHRFTNRILTWQTEETKNADKNGAYGILGSITISLVVGYAYILALSFVVIDPAALLDPGNDAGGYAVGQLFYQIFKDRYGSGTGGILCLGVIAVAIYFASVACVLSNSRYFTPPLKISIKHHLLLLKSSKHFRLSLQNQSD